MNFNNFNEIELNNEMFKNIFNQNYNIFYMPTIKFDEIEAGEYKVLFIGRNNAYLFELDEEFDFNFIPKYHLNETSSKVIFEKVKHKLFKRTKVLNILYRDYNIEIDVKIKESKQIHSDSFIYKKVYLRDYNRDLTSIKNYILYNEKDLMKDYNKYSKIYSYEDVPKTNIIKKDIHRYLPKDIDIGKYDLIEDEDDEIRLYTPEKGFVKVRLYYIPFSYNEYQEFRIFDKEIRDRNNDKDDDEMLYRREGNFIRRNSLSINEDQDLNDKYDFEEEFIDVDEIKNIIVEEKEEEDEYNEYNEYEEYDEELLRSYGMIDISNYDDDDEDIIYEDHSDRIYLIINLLMMKKYLNY